MFLAGPPSQGCFGRQSHCAPCYFFNQASFYPSDFSFRGEATTMLDHHINTENSPPISVPIVPLRKRSRPPKDPQTPGSSSGRR
ncbi:hypothetical protein TNCV_4271091 [Trichonephila clavipes]|nr:hypothetical protein TNCV_4271091 [Trichonephila clavipes]